MSRFSFPSWIEGHLTEDGHFAAAYDALSDRQRGVCKVSMARLESLYGGILPECQTVRSEKQGRSYFSHTTPAPWALFLVGHAFTSPVRLLAALMPAVLAGVPDILVCRVREGAAPAPVVNAVLTSLELAGQETVADISPSEAGELVEYACGHMDGGRLLFLGPFPGCERLFLSAVKRGFPCRAEFDVPRIAVTSAAQALLEREEAPEGTFYPSFEYLHFAHPDASVITLGAEELPGAEAYSCVLCAEEEVDSWLLSAPLVLTPGEEACWVWPDVSPAFFMETRRAII